MKKYFYLLALSFLMISTACTAQLRVVNPVTNRTFQNADLAAIYLADSLTNNSIKLKVSDTLEIVFDSTFNGFYYSSSNSIFISNNIITDDFKFMYLELAEDAFVDTLFNPATFVNTDSNTIRITFSVADTITFNSYTVLYRNVLFPYYQTGIKIPVPKVTLNNNEIFVVTFENRYTDFTGSPMIRRLLYTFTN